MNVLSRRNTFETLSRAVRRPRLAIREMSRIATAPVRRYRFRQKYGTGCDIMSKDWDNLLILDACRYDLFRDINELEGNLDFVISKGSHSKEFYRENFADESYDDTIMISANPYTPIVANNSFFYLKTTFEDGQPAENKPRVGKSKTDEGRLVEATHIENVHPESLNELARTAIDRYPHKRLIIHYMQPHDPYLGSTAESIRESFNKDGTQFRYWADSDTVSDDSPPGLMYLAREGSLSPDKMATVYRENLRIVLEYVDELLSDLNGKTIVTSDHGELLGERVGNKQFFHYNNIYTEKLRKVPWLAIESTDRREISEDVPVSDTTVDESDLKNRLKLLGYK